MIRNENKYTAPSLEIIKLECHDIVTISNFGSEGTGAGSVDQTIYEEGAW